MLTSIEMVIIIGPWSFPVVDSDGVIGILT
jgi:hypothetical protein